MYIPNLFGAYAEGREYANDQNWKDLKNYEAIEAARNANDIGALDILRQRAQFGGEMSNFQNLVDQSSRSNEVAEYMQPGLVAQAQMGATGAQVQNSVLNNNLPAYAGMTESAFIANVGSGQNAADTTIATNDYLAGQTDTLGRLRGSTAANNIEANSITADFAPEQAYRQGLIANAGQRYNFNESIDNLNNQETAQQLSRQVLENGLKDAQQYNRIQADQRTSQMWQTLVNLNAEYALNRDPVIGARVRQLGESLGVDKSVLPPTQEEILRAQQEAQARAAAQAQAQAQAAAAAQAANPLVQPVTRAAQPAPTSYSQPAFDKYGLLGD